MSDFTWSDSLIAILRKGSTEKFSAREIAALVSERAGHQCTRMAVIGKMHRLGIPLRGKKAPKTKPPRSSTLAATQAKSTLPSRVKRQASTAPPSGSVIENIATAQIAIPDSATLMDLDNETCRWPLGDPRLHGFCYCGAPSADLAAGKPYCRDHSKLAYVQRHQSNPPQSSPEMKQRARAA